MRFARTFLASLLALVTVFVAGCNNGKEPTFQGWIEAELIFVGPDENGRIETLPVREGDQVEPRSPLFTLDADLQLADVAMQEAAVKNAQIAFDRAQAAAEDASRHATGVRRRRGGAAHRAGAAQFGADQAGAAQGVQPGHRQRAADLLPRRRAGAGRQADRRAAAAGQHEGAVLRQRGDAAQAQHRRAGHHQLRRLRQRPHRQDQLHRPHLGVHAAGDLQPGGALQARVPDRGAPGAAGTAARRPARQRHVGTRHSERGSRTCARHRHRRRRADEILRRPQGRAQPVDAGEARRDLRLPRPQRLGQDHDHPHAVRAAHAGRGPRHLPRLRHPHPGRRDQAPCRLHDAALQPLSGPLGAREPRIRRPPLRRRRSGRVGAGDDRAARARRPRGAACRRALRRLEAAARARRLHAAEPAAAAARRADRRRRSQGAARVLERDPCARGPRASPCWSPPITWTRPSAATRSLISPTACCSRTARWTR